MADAHTSRFVISGRVQGVGFRAATRAEAIALGIDGQATNRADGTVEVIAGGEPERIERFARWLGVGPAHAQVERVDRSPYEGKVEPGFRIG